MHLFRHFFLLVFGFVYTNYAIGQSDITISTVLTNPSCAGTSTGSITITATGGSGSYQYELNESNAGGWQSATRTYTGLIAGTYPVSVRDNSNNYKTVYVTLSDPSAITANVTSTTASCSTTNDATITVSPSGGTGSYNYVWSYSGSAVTSTDTRFKNYNSATIMGPSGIYSVAVTDSKGCSGAVTYYNASTIPLTAASFTQDVIVERTASNAILNTNVTSKLDNDATGYVLFESGFPNNGTTTDGLPQNNTITSAQDNSLTYALRPYNANNSARTAKGASSTLTLTTPTAYGKLLVLGTSGNGSSTYNYSVNFSDGTTYTGTLNNNSIIFRDWFALTGPDIALKALNRVALGSNQRVSNGNVALFEAPIILPQALFNKNILSISLTNISSTTDSRGNIFAVSGFKASGTSETVGYAVGATTQPSVTISSNLDSSTNYFCAGQTINFSATTVHGGTAPTYLLEQSINGAAYTTIATAATTNTYSYTTNENTTSVAIRVTATASSDAGCLTTKTSNQTIFTATKGTVTSTVVSTGPTAICQGTNANYYVTNQSNGGSSPTFTWYDGTTNIGSGPSLNVSNLSSGTTHPIQVKMLSSIGCASNNSASYTINTNVTASPVPSVSISNYNSSIPVTYAISSSQNLGANPQYQWYLNNSPITGATGATYTTSTSTVSGDIYSLKVTSSATCANPATLMSNYRTIATALPIVLKSFVATAYSNNITLNWQTATEINTDRFEILRNYQDSSDYVVIGTVKASNNSTGSSYQFIDYPRLAGTYYYRLKNYDFDGNYQLSDIQSIYYGNNSNSQVNKIYPNPFSDHLTINYSSLKSFQGSIMLYNMNGIVVNSKKIQVVNGIQNFELSNLSGLPSGVYLIKIADQYNNSLVTFKAIKK